MNTIYYYSLQREEVARKHKDLMKFVDETAELIKLEVLQCLFANRNPSKFPHVPKKFKIERLINKEKVIKEYRTVGMVVADRINSMEKTKKEASLANLDRLYNPELKERIKSLSVDLTSRKSIWEQIEVRALYSAFCTERYAQQMLADWRDVVQSESTASSAETAKLNTGLRLRLHEVKCLNETNPGIGDDEISLGGVFVDDKENSSKIKQFKVRDDFEAGKVEPYVSPEKQLIPGGFCPLGGDYPKTFAAFISLAEKDGGGFGDFLNDLWEAVEAKVVEVLTILATTAFGAALGAAAIGGAMAGLLGAIAGFILGAIIGWLVGCAKDDIFEPQVASITLPSANAAFEGGTLTSPELSLTFKDFGGKYSVKYGWEIAQ